MQRVSSQMTSKRMIRWLGCIALFIPCMNAWSTNWLLLGQTSEHQVWLDTDSVERLANGDMAYLSMDIAKTGYLPAGASEVLAIADTRYEMDCYQARWMERSTEYFSDEGKEVGKAPEAKAAWAKIEDGTDPAFVYKKIC
ncbi:hypothetical protein BWP39_15750 [Paraburkholderia acidicola]|uniref:Surface-adhesin protein E-like domain-containing protein n=3 Tax=Paraburkholderia acidicola TaxID=1912599 RepID=A0A2A4EZV8_9BURK|nr:hypothetical protein BWP39_15750 [Paraburkholderia acidicola]